MTYQFRNRERKRWTKWENYIGLALQNPEFARLVRDNDRVTVKRDDLKTQWRVKK